MTLNNPRIDWREIVSVGQPGPASLIESIFGQESGIPVDFSGKIISKASTKWTSFMTSHSKNPKVSRNNNNNFTCTQQYAIMINKNKLTKNWEEYRLPQITIGTKERISLWFFLKLFRGRSLMPSLISFQTKTP